MGKTQTIIALLVLMYGCTKEYSYQKDFYPQLVVDGYIENGGYAHVAITRNIPYYVSIDSSNLTRLIIRQAIVTISNSKDSEVLTLTYDKNQMPPWYYKSTELRGSVGDTFQLTVDWDTLHLTAQTTIPKVVLPDSIWFSSNSQDADKGYLCLRIADNGTETNYYKVFTTISGKQDTYTPALKSVFSDWYFNGLEYIFTLSKGVDSYLSLASEDDFYFTRGDTVSVKFCSIDEASFLFWKGYYSEAINGANPFASSFHSVPSNIQGGLGVWCGYGQTIKQVILK